MKEVSCRVFEIFMKPLAKKGVALSAIVEGTGITVETLRDRKERIAWSQFAAVMGNMRAHFTDEEYIELGRSFMHSPALRFAFVVARLAFSPIDIYRWSNKPRDGLGNQMFSCVQVSYQEKSANDIVLELTLPEGYEPCWDFNVIVAGNNEELPCLFGLPRAKVELVQIARGARFEITVPTWRVPLFKRIIRFVTWPFTARSAARELKEAHENLIGRYAELEDARAKIDRQAMQLQTAHDVNELVQRDLDLARTLETIVTTLVERAGFTWAEIRILDNAQSKQAGRTDHEQPLVRPLVTHGGRAVGELLVAPKRGANLAEREELLDFIVPNLSMAVENASYRTNLERLVDQRTAELREAQSARQRFFGNISHEFRTPLTIITLAASDVAYRAQAALDTRAKKNLDTVQDAARKLVRLVDELLLLAAGQEGRLDVKPEPTDLAELVRHLDTAYQLSVEAAGLGLYTRAPKSLVVNVDPVAIERVVSNLISNAVKFTPRGGRIDVTLAETENGIQLAVLDTGPGISEELAGRLFGRFERGHAPGIAGTGLGLALSKYLVEQHGGTIHSVPRPAGGAELRIVFPRERLISEVIARKPLQLRVVDSMVVQRAAEHAPPETSRGVVLLAEDDTRLAELVGRLLAADYTVIVAHDGLTALELARRHQPQLLITDVDMPGLDGMELARRFRELTGDRLAPIIILSAMLDHGTRVAGLEAGAIDYVTKPFDPLELRARVAAQFRARDLAVRLHRAEQLTSLGVLTSGLAHELRNPANAIVNAIEPLLKKLPAELAKPEHAVGQLIDVVRECADQISTLARQLLGMRGTGELEMREVPLRDVVQRALALAHDALIGIDVRLDVSPVTLRCAPPLMTQVLANLFENAGHAAGANGWLAVRAKTNGTQLVIEVSDSGAGVPLAVRERVFEPFFTTKAVGTGLGLTLVRDIVTRHRGTIEIRDRGESSVFVVTMPGVSAPALTADAV